MSWMLRRAEYCIPQALVMQATVARFTCRGTIFDRILCNTADTVEQEQRDVIAHQSLVVRSVIAEICQRCCKIPRADDIDTSRLHDCAPGVVQLNGGVCPPVSVQPVDTEAAQGSKQRTSAARHAQGSVQVVKAAYKHSMREYYGTTHSRYPYRVLLPG